LCLIQGPPRTGKSEIAVNIAYHMVKMNKAKVLVCAQSNIVVDQLATKLHKTGINVVRVLSKAKEKMLFSDTEDWTLQYKVQQELRRKYGLDIENASAEQIMKIGRDLIDSADVICTTCVTAGDSIFDSFTFEHVIIDEATQSTEPETLIPLMRGAKQVILIGDHKQLGPVVQCKEAQKKGFEVSLFERLVKIGIKPIMMPIQFRMSPALAELPSKLFYEGRLVNGVTSADRMPVKGFPWPRPDKGMFFLNVREGKEEKWDGRTSVRNVKEAIRVKEIVKRLMKAGVKAQKIGIISFYTAQRNHIKYMFSKLGESEAAWNDVEVNSVDGFQGREMDYIVISCVRTKNLGFLNDARRINVAITRARHGMVICGNAGMLSSESGLWRELIDTYEKLGLLVEGSLDKLQSSEMNIVNRTMLLNEEEARVKNVKSKFSLLRFY